MAEGEEKPNHPYARYMPSWISHNTSFRIFVHRINIVLPHILSLCFFRIFSISFSTEQGTASSTWLRELDVVFLFFFLLPEIDFREWFSLYVQQIDHPK